MAAGGVDQKPYLDSLLCFGGQRAGHLVADLASPPDVRLEVHALARLGDIGEEMRKELIPVFQKLDLISLIETGLGQPHH